MKVVKILLYLFSILVLLMSISPYLTNLPPVSVLVTLLRLPYQFLSQWLIYLMGLLDFLLLLLLFLHKIKPSPVNLVLIFIITVCLILDIIYGVRIQNAIAKKSGIEYELQQSETTKSIIYEKQDESENPGMSQLMVYLPQDNSADICLVHLNYGGWSVQNANSRLYLERFCEEHGYAFVQLAGIGKENGDLTDIVKSIKQGISFVQQKYGFKHTYLTGGSAGGHLALVTAFSGSKPEMYGETQVKVDGVIALYSPTNLDYQYRYFVEDHPAKSVFGKMGDWLYCSLFHGETGTLGGETAKIQEKLLGKYSKENVLYQVSNVENLVQNQEIPVLMIQGEKDSQLGTSDTLDLYTYLKENAKSVVYLPLPGIDHAYDMVFPEQSYQGKRTLLEIENWMKAVTMREETN